MSTVTATVSDLTPITEQDEQLTFDGIPVAEARFSLKSVNRLYTNRKLQAGSHVKGTFNGRVKGYTYDVDTGALTNVIEVLDAELDA